MCIPVNSLPDTGTNKEDIYHNIALPVLPHVSAPSEQTTPKYINYGHLMFYGP